MSRIAFVLLLAAAALAAVLAVRKMECPVHEDRTAVSEEPGSGTVAAPPLKEQARRGRDEAGACRLPASPAPHTDESPWPETSGAESVQDPPPVGGGSGPQWNAESLSDLEGLRQALRSMHGSNERRAAFRGLLAGGEAGVAAALAMYWSARPDEPWVGDFVVVLRASAPPFLAGWLADAADSAPNPTARARFRELLGQLQGPPAAEAMASIAMGTSDPELRQDMLALLEKRRATSEADVLANALLVGDAEVATAAARGLAVIGGAHAYASLLASAEDPELADLALNALGSTHSPFGQSALLDMATDPGQSIAVRTASIRSLARSRSRRVLAALENTPCATAEPSVEAAVKAAMDVLRESCQDDGTSADMAGSIRVDERWF